MAYKTHGCLRRTPILAVQIKRSTNIKRDEINMMNIIGDNSLNPHNSLLDNNKMCMKVTLESKRIRVAR